MFRVYNTCLKIKYFCLSCCSKNPVQEWGEETEDGAVYGVTLRREPVLSSPTPDETTSPCCGFIQYRTYKVRRLKAAPLDQLVNHLLNCRNQEQDYSRIFLSTYRTFTSTTKLIELLFHKYVQNWVGLMWGYFYFFSILYLLLGGKKDISGNVLNGATPWHPNITNCL